MRTSLLFLIFIHSFSSFSQSKIEIISETKGLSFRGLSVVSDKILWVSGSKGTVGRSINGGVSFEWQTVKGYETTDFRDIEAFSDSVAIIMAIAEPAYILKTIDAGKTWKIVFESHKKGMFLDAMDFENGQKGKVIGDAVDGNVFVASTNDGGNTWQPMVSRQAALDQEGCFASSGTNIICQKDNFYFVTGGKNSRYFKNGVAFPISIIQGLESTGANSIAVSKNGKNIIIVGGDFSKKNDTIQNCIISNNGGNSFSQATKNPSGYRSCVIFLDKKGAITCGLNGVDISKDYGANWLNISPESFHVCQKAKSGKVIYFAGANGRIGKLILN
jgi:hypothetical protein